MGGVNSQSATVNNAVTGINELILNVINNTKNEMSQSCSTVQDISISIKGNVQIDNLTTSQISAVSCNFTANALTEMSSKMTAEMNNKLDQIISQASKSTQEFMSLSASEQDSNISNSTYMKNTINQAITNAVTNTCTQNISLQQGQTVVIENNTPYVLKISNISLEQNLQVISMANCVLNNVLNSISDNKTANDIINQIDQKQTSEQTGLSGLLLPLLILLGGGVFIFLMVSGKGMEIVQNPKKVAMIAGSVFLIYFIMAFSFGWTPFKKSEKFLSLKNILVKPYDKYDPNMTANNENTYQIL